MLKNIGISFLVAVVVVAGYAYFFNPATFGSLPNANSNITPNQAEFVTTATVNQFSLGPMTASTSSATSTVSFPRGASWGFATGDTCLVQLSSATSTTGFSEDAQLTAVGSQIATATVTFFNGANAAVTIATGTVTLVCNHYGH